ncbi:MAG: hypothetical protein D3910_24110 [Candidatus Electrothrix sp. ATG2]|nr:hypothetical protein [Candidatus Electrothrix sp. ATG2]
MVTISFFFWTLVALFAIIGSMRGWAREMLVTFSLVMALFVMQVALTHIGPVKKLWEYYKGENMSVCPFYFPCGDIKGEPKASSLRDLAQEDWTINIISTR